MKKKDRKIKKDKKIMMGVYLIPSSVLYTLLLLALNIQVKRRIKRIEE